jgi:acyl-coenzyme A thioesterase PaaI-like protein
VTEAHAAVDDWFAAIPFTGAIGLAVEAIGGPVSRCHLPFQPAFRAGDGPDRLCEGLITGAIDQAASLAVWSAVGTGVPHATICLGVSFLRPAALAPLRLETRALVAGPTLAQTEVTVWQADRLVARAGVDYAIGRFPGGGRPGAAVALAGGPRHALPAAADFAGALGLSRDGHDAALPFAGWLIGSREPVALHGGALAAAAVITARRALGDGMRLFDISMDYLRAGLPEPALMHAHAMSRTRATARAEVDARQHDGARQVSRLRARFVAGEAG